MKSLAVNLPYPTLDNIKTDKKSAIIISNAYASSHGELNSILQYVYHYFHLKSLNEQDIAKTVIGIAISEMHHLEILASLMLKLGADPTFIKPFYGLEYYSTASVSYSKSVQKMLMDDISMELVAINQYEKINSALTDEKVQSVILRLKLDEELHVKALRNHLDALRDKQNKSWRYKRGFAQTFLILRFILLHLKVS